MAGRTALEADDAALTPQPGTYALGLHLDGARTCEVGALGTWTLPPGLYVYVGSAWGPGGLAARVGRHLRGGRVQRWHIDYLRPHARPVALWLAPQSRRECAWARRLTAAAYADVVVPRFGASDCDCAAHLFHLGELPPADLTLPPARYRPWTAAP